MSNYLDHAATTPVRPVAIETMLPYLRDRIGNPSGAHRAAREARRAIDDVRDVLADALGVGPGDIVFTSGGTEADNLAVLGVHGAVGGTVVCAATEHHAVIHPVEVLGGRVVGVDRHGCVDLDALSDALDDSVTLVSVMLVNNETGTVQPLDDVASLCRERAPRALLHTDAVQAITWFDVGERAARADLVSISAHKFGGPKGVGALAVRGDLPLRPLVFGGGQERDRRSGTQNVPGIVAMGAAAAEARTTRAETRARVERLAGRLRAGLVDAVEGLQLTVEPAEVEVAPGIVHVCVPGVDSEALLFLLEEAGVYASAGSSCSSGALVVSGVLGAMGVPHDVARGALRLSLGYDSTDDDVDAVLAALPAAAARVRQAA